MGNIEIIKKFWRLKNIENLKRQTFKEVINIDQNGLPITKAVFIFIILSIFMSISYFCHKTVKKTIFKKKKVKR